MVGIAGKIVFDELHDVKTAPACRNCVRDSGRRAASLSWSGQEADGDDDSSPWYEQ